MIGLGLLSGLGAGAIDSGLNTFAAMRFSTRMLNWLHACYGIGAATGPVIMTRVLAGREPWQRGYMIVGGWQLLLAACFAVTRALWSKTTPEHQVSESNPITTVVGFQIASAVLGQSLLPALIGLVARRLGLEIIGAALFIFAAVLIGLQVSLATSSPNAECAHEVAR